MDLIGALAHNALHAPQCGDSLWGRPAARERHRGRRDRRRPQPPGDSFRARRPDRW